MVDRRDRFAQLLRVEQAVRAGGTVVDEGGFVEPSLRDQPVLD